MLKIYSVFLDVEFLAEIEHYSCALYALGKVVYFIAASTTVILLSVSDVLIVACTN